MTDSSKKPSFLSSKIELQRHSKRPQTSQACKLVQSSALIDVAAQVKISRKDIKFEKAMQIARQLKQETDNRVFLRQS
jgi:hypothetical protein